MILGATVPSSLVAELWLLVERRRYYKRDVAGAEQARRNARTAEDAAELSRLLHRRPDISGQRMREIYQ